MQSLTARRSLAQRIADEIAEHDGMNARIWIPRDTDEDERPVRVYATRELSRGRRQDMGYVELAADGTVTHCWERRSAGMYRMIEGALSREEV